MDNYKNINPQDVMADEPAKEAGFHEFPAGGRGKLSRFLTPKINLKSFGFFGGGAIIAVIIVILLIAIPSVAVYGSAKKLESSARDLKSSVDEQNLDNISKSLKNVKSDLKTVETALIPLTWIKIIPFVGGYWHDLDNAAKGGIAGVEAAQLLLKAVEPYADILGFNGGEQAEDGAKTAEDRINFIVETIDTVVPQLDAVSEKTKKMSDHFAKIDSNRYPEKFQGKQIREPIKQGIQLIQQGHSLITDGKPVLSQAPYLLGTKGERTYLMLFQNDKELRPTGGFITAYSIVKVKNGKFDPVASNDIYNLDNKLKSKIPSPDGIKKYLPLVPYWNLRDMNLSPDFKVSMDTFFENYQKTKSPQVDGIIAIDTKLAVDLLKVIGRIGVPGFGNFSSEDDPRCNCPVVIYELESYADVAGPIIWADDLGGKIILKPANSDNRKAILGPLMNSIIANAMGQPKEKIPDLFQAGFNALLEKHVLFYFGNGEVQEAMESFNLGGRVREFDGDYLHINDSNFAGAKSNLYVEQEVNLNVERKKDKTINSLSIKYKNPQKNDGWLNGPYRDWVRVYVPKGSVLIDSTGSEVEIEQKEELGKTLFEGFFMLRPEGVIELTFKYETPLPSKNSYKLLIQKQPGTDGNLYNVSVNGSSEEFLLKTDKELHF